MEWKKKSTINFKGYKEIGELILYFHPIFLPRTLEI
jgi:hypothetical protein